MVIPSSLAAGSAPLCYAPRVDSAVVGVVAGSCPPPLRGFLLGSVAGADSRGDASQPIVMYAGGAKIPLRASFVGRRNFAHVARFAAQPAERVRPFPYAKSSSVVVCEQDVVDNIGF